MAWIMLILGIVAELGGSICMKLSFGFTKILPSIFVFVFFWAGMGIMLVSIIGMVFFKESYNWLKIVSIITIMLGVISLNMSEILFSSTNKDSKSRQLAKNIEMT